MRNKLILLILEVFLTIAISLPARAIDVGLPNTNYRAETSGAPWRRSTAIVLFAGIGGAILGLSTLSFYGSPGEHTNNINSGAFLGVCGGIGYLFYESQMPKYNSTNSYGEMFPQSNGPIVAKNVVPKINYTFDF